MNEIYIVRGTRGEYSDTRIWNVEAFEDKQQADSVAEFLNHLASSYNPYSWEDNSDEIAAETRKKILVLDPSFEDWYTGTTYAVSAVPFKKKDY